MYFKHKKLNEIINKVSAAGNFALRDFQSDIIHFIGLQILKKNRFLIVLLLPGLGKTSMCPYIIAIMELDLKQDHKILVIVPEPFLAASTVAKL